MAGVFRSRFPLVQLVRRPFPFTVTSGSIKALSGQFDGASTFSGSLVKTAVLSGTITGTSTFAGTVVRTAVLSGQFDGVSTFAGTLSGSSTAAVAQEIIWLPHIHLHGR